MKLPQDLKVSVVIRTYTVARWNTFVNAVESILRQTQKPDEIVIIVDHNPDLMVQVQEHFPNIIVAENKGRPGSAGAWNACVRESTGDVIVFFDDDAVAEENWLEKLLPYYEDERILGVGGAIEGLWLSDRPSWFPNEFDWVVGCTYKGLAEETSPIRNLIGCNMSYRRSVFEQIGGFRSELGHLQGVPVGCDETEFCIRLGKHYPEHHLLYVPSASVNHTIPASRTTFRYFLSRCYLEGRSKALVSHLSGTAKGLESESRYVMYVLPQGVMRGIVDGLRGDLDGFRRAGAIITGLGVTGVAYLLQRVKIKFQRQHFEDIPANLISEIES